LGESVCGRFKTPPTTPQSWKKKNQKPKKANYSSREFFFVFYPLKLNFGIFLTFYFFSKKIIHFFMFRFCDAAKRKLIKNYIKKEPKDSEFSQKVLMKNQLRY